MPKQNLGLFRNAVTLASGQVYNLILIFLGRIVLARILGVGAFGAFGAALNAITVSSRMLSFGSASAGQYFASKGEHDRKVVFGTSLVISLVVTTLSGLALHFLSPVILTTFFKEHPEGIQAFSIMVWFVPLIILTMNMGVLLVPFGMVKIYNWSQILQSGFVVIPCVAMALFLPSLTASVSAQIFAWALSALIIGIYLVRATSGLGFDTRLAHQMVKFGFKAWPNVCLNIGIARVATLVGAIYLGSAELGVFVLALNLVEAACSPQIAAGQMVLTRAADNESSVSVLRLMRLSTAYFLCIALGLYLFSMVGVSAIFGEGFSSVSSIIAILSLTGAAHGMMKTFANYAAGKGKPHYATLGLGTEAILLALALPSLGPVFGIYGVAWASAISALGGWGVAVVQMNRLSGCNAIEQSIPTKADIIELKHHVHQMVKRSA